MRIFYVLAFCTILALSFSATAQDAEAGRYSSSRLENSVSQLKRQTVDLVDRTSEDLRRSNTNSRADIEAAFLAQQVDASVGFFQELIRDNRRAAELRDGASILSDLIRRAPNSGTNNALWRDTQKTINDINRELGGNNGGGNNDDGDDFDTGGGQRAGKAFWRGTVDKEVQLVIQKRVIETRTVSGAPYNNEVFSFTSSLPTRNVTVSVTKKSGRGNVRVIEQPSRDNGYTAIVQILDEGGGAKEYQLEISWQ